MQPFPSYLVQSEQRQVRAPWDLAARRAGSSLPQAGHASWWPAQAEAGAEAGAGPAGRGEGCPLGLPAGVTGSKADFKPSPPLDYKLSVAVTALET